MKNDAHIAIAGATGAVGAELMAILQERNFPIGKLSLLASPRSSGRQLPWKTSTLTVGLLEAQAFADVDLAFFCAGGERSKTFAPAAAQAGAIVIDNSSAFRMDAEVPLVVPEVNAQALEEHQGIIANPNCSTIAMVVPLKPLHDAFGIERVQVCTYQAASGGGQAAMDELEGETRAYLSGDSFSRKIFAQPYAFNLFPHDSPLDDQGYCQEERKMIRETRKILALPQLAVNATCVRVPVLRAHSEALNLRFSRPVTVEEAYQVLDRAPGVRIFEDRPSNRWATPRDASGQDDVLVGRLRRDTSQPNTLDLWLVCDQLRKGAALNAIQIAEALA